jgi:hypothetical protein
MCSEKRTNFDKERNQIQGELMDLKGKFEEEKHKIQIQLNEEQNN